MSTCKDCLHDEACDIYAGDLHKEGAEKCICFKDRNRFVELPCKVGDTVYLVDNQEIISYQFDNIVMFLESKKDGICFALLRDFNKTMFLTKEEAEQALKCSEKPNSKKE